MQTKQMKVNFEWNSYMTNSIYADQQIEIISFLELIRIGWRE